MRKQNDIPAYMHEVMPSVVPMAERMLIKV